MFVLKSPNRWRKKIPIFEFFTPKWPQYPQNGPKRPPKWGYLVSQGILGNVGYQKNRLGEHFEPVKEKIWFSTFWPHFWGRKCPQRAPKSRLFGEPSHIGACGVSKEPSWRAFWAGRKKNLIFDILTPFWGPKAPQRVSRGVSNLKKNVEIFFA